LQIVAKKWGARSPLAKKNPPANDSQAAKNDRIMTKEAAVLSFLGLCQFVIPC
jgi:hypothetical protein